jgi:predicted Zn-dependent peptidase
MAAIKACHKTGAEISDVELSRARNHLFRSLLSQESSLQATAGEIGLELLYLKRRVPPAEIAARAMLMDAKYLEKVYQKWLWNCDMAIAFYGNNLPERKYAEYRAFTMESKR